MEQEPREDVDAMQTGHKGGAASMAAGTHVPARTALAYWSPDTIRWGAVWSGLLIAMALDLVLISIGIASAFSGYMVTDPNYAADVSMFLSIWMAASLIVSLFIGGWVAGRNGALLGMRAGWYQGTVVWALALIASLLLGMIVSAGGLGIATNLMPVLTAASGDGMMSAAETTAAATRAAQTISIAAWIFLIASVLQWGAASLGGWFGARGHVVEEADIES